MSKSKTERKPARDLNVLVIGGNLTNSVMFHGSFATFGLAVHKFTKINGELVNATCFFEVKVFGATADACARYLTRGRRVLITGSISTDEYKLKSNGRVVYYDGDRSRPVMMRVPVVLANDVRFL